ncbi:hypothetical protein [Bradyrhizobium canariense]|uniref:Uncharacterized protein n=1 Tax=Bradyrhizobium canariense TaxID=255045 RepID=A0A1H1WSV5_9BRAD|nr:hypothetical protein [Bradyrhizobium canariense]SDT00253.1 hypothetical protein SAMN05444158_3999 [Bradyrhizobium canariense]
MSSLPESLLADMCDIRLALIAETAGNFKAQLLDLTKLRDQVRKAEQSVLRFEARKSTDWFVLSGSKPTPIKPFIKQDGVIGPQAGVG